ncbi:MAG: hypothetical protein ACE5H1_01780 [Thermodesulfobacteriota bacterium]
MPYQKLDQSQWGKGDFTDITGEAITGTIYTDEKLTSAFDLTGYTLELIFYDPIDRKVVKNDLAGTIVTAASGTWRFLPSDGDLNFNFVGELLMKLTKSGTELHAWSVSGSAKFMLVDTD